MCCVSKPEHFPNYRIANLFNSGCSQSLASVPRSKAWSLSCHFCPDYQGHFHALTQLIPREYERIFPGVSLWVLTISSLCVAISPHCNWRGCKCFRYNFAKMLNDKTDGSVQHGSIGAADLVVTVWAIVDACCTRCRYSRNYWRRSCRDASMKAFQYRRPYALQIQSGHHQCPG